MVVHRTNLENLLSKKQETPQRRFTRVSSDEKRRIKGVPTVHEKELFTEPGPCVRGTNAKEVSEGGIRLFRGDVRRHRKSINGRGPRRNVARRYTFSKESRDDDAALSPFGRSRNIVLKNILGLSYALIASRSAGPEYDCFIIRSSSRTWKLP